MDVEELESCSNSATTIVAEMLPASVESRETENSPGAKASRMMTKSAGLLVDVELAEESVACPKSQNKENCETERSINKRMRRVKKDAAAVNVWEGYERRRRKQVGRVEDRVGRGRRRERRRGFERNLRSPDDQRVRCRLEIAAKHDGREADPSVKGETVKGEHEVGGSSNSGEQANLRVRTSEKVDESVEQHCGLLLRCVLIVSHQQSEI